MPLILPRWLAQRIALFLSVDGEINTRPLIAKLWQQKKQVFLPVLHPFAPGHLLFALHARNPLRPNKLRIPEPPLDITQLATLDQLDVMLVPLVAFDAQDNAGMGGVLRSHATALAAAWLLPLGIAHDCQRVDALPVAAWDVPLPAILTPSKLWQWETLAG